MEKIKNHFTEIFAFLLFIQFFQANSIDAQGSRGLPSMFVKKDVGKMFEQNYIASGSKYDLLSSYLKTKKETKSIFYSRDAFISLITYFESLKPAPAYVRVFIASYSQSGADVPLGWENQLCLLFCPEDKAEKSLGYFMISDHDFKFQLINDQTAAEWIKNYTDGEKMKILTGNIPHTNDNLFNGTVSDTRSIKYTQDDFDQLLIEIRYQRDTLNIPVSGIQAFFAAYNSAGDYVTGKFKNRLLVQFEFMKKIAGADQVFYIEETPRPSSFKRTKKNLKPQSLLNNLSIDRMFSEDNGQLCPTFCQ